MATWIKWWKDKTFMTVLAIALLTMLFGWIITIVLTIAGGVSIRKIIINRIIKELEKEEGINKKV